MHMGHKHITIFPYVYMIYHMRMGPIYYAYGGRTPIATIFFLKYTDFIHCYLDRVIGVKPSEK